MTQTEENRTAEQILHYEQRLINTLSLIPECREMLWRGAQAGSQTRHVTVQLMTAALHEARRNNADPAVLARASSEWSEAHALRWLLAVSAQHVARREARRAASHVCPAEDLEQEGLLGLIRAAERYEPGRGVRFSAYARWWVRAQISNAVQGAGTFKVSVCAMETRRNLHKLRRIDEQAGTHRAVSELAKELRVSIHRLRDVMAACAIRAAEEPVDGDGPSVSGALEDRVARSPEHCVGALEDARWLRNMIRERFMGREHEIMMRRYGIDCDVSSIAMIAADLSLSTERVRQLEHQCVEVLRDLFRREMDV